ncbi:MAG: hypothetical protein JRJ87_26155 [Deltaproteobacteria bacterium]|nr:hypothetical protein [Deltaproteobacteria bacterium]
MKRFLLTALLLIVTVFLLAGCGGGCKNLCGSECELIDCSHSKIVCQKYPTALAIHYKKVISEGEETWAAKINIDTEDIDPIEGHLFELVEFTDRVLLSRPGQTEQFHDFDGVDCQITSGGDQAETNMTGQCNFSFVNGYFMTADFICTPEAV